MLLGVDATTVVGHGSGSPSQIAACIRLAARAAERGLIADLQARLAVATEPA
jgi:fatty acid/phospholipid biosynthesis enzyme